MVYCNGCCNWHYVGCFRKFLALDFLEETGLIVDFRKKSGVGIR